MLWACCATVAMPEEIFRSLLRHVPIAGDSSSQSSNGKFLNAQAKCIPAARCARFPHFHSDGYYYGLYTSYKTG
jgi:hypothetical protein